MTDPLLDEGLSMLFRKQICYSCRRAYWEDELTYVDPNTKEPLRAGPRSTRSPEWKGWRDLPKISVCREGHAVDTGSQRRIAVMLVGDTASGKDAMINAIVHEVSTGELLDRGVHGALQLGQSQYSAVEPSEFKGAATQQGVRETIILKCGDDSGTRDPRDFDVVVFNAAGEDFSPPEGQVRLTPNDAWQNFSGLAYADVLVCLVPPEALLDLPSDRRDAVKRDQERRTEFAVKAIVRALRRKRHFGRRGMTIVVALTKSDRYRGLDGFPQRLLLPRRHHRQDLESLDVVMYNEQAELHDFVTTYGGAEILRAAAGVTGKYYLVAVSGTGSDVERDEEDRAPAPDLASNRSLDPILIRLLLEDYGRLSEAVAPIRSGR